MLVAFRRPPPLTSSLSSSSLLLISLLFLVTLLVRLIDFAAETAVPGVKGVIALVGVLRDHLIGNDAVLSEGDVPAVSDGVDGVQVVLYPDRLEAVELEDVGGYHSPFFPVDVN